MGTTVGITSHRHHTPADMGLARTAMRSLVANPKVEHIVFGGAIGLDTVLLEAALEFRTDPKRPELIVIVPDSVEKQPVVAQRAIRRADTVWELHNEITALDGFDSYKIRNEKIVELSDTIVAFWNGNMKTGTGHCVNVAKRAGKKVIIVKVMGKS